jgi:transposase
MSKRNASTNQNAWLGLDVGKDSFVASIDLPWAAGTEQTSLEKLPAKSFPRTLKGAEDCLEWADNQLEKAGLELKKIALRVVMEATGCYSLDLFHWLVSIRERVAPAVLNPSQAARYLQSRSPRRKDDFIDARGLARLGTERSPAPFDPPTGIRRELREVLRLRTSLVAQRDALKNQLSQLTLGGGKETRRILEMQIRQTQVSIVRCEKSAARLIRKDKVILADVRKLETIYGVGKLTAMSVVAELGDLRRFDSADQLACFCGLTPRIRESGKYKGKPKLSKCGNSRIRGALYMPTVVITSKETTDMGVWYRKKLGEGMHLMCARTAVMRKLLERMWYVLVRDLEYERFPQQNYAKG